MQKTFQLKLIIFFLIGCFFLTSSSCIHTSQSGSSSVKKKQALTAKLQGMNQKLSRLNAEIKKHKSNASKMQAILDDANKNHTKPDISKLHQVATATGQRTPVYHSSPPWLQALIDKFESRNRILPAIELACSMAWNGIHKAHYMMEIKRTNQFIRMLNSERDKIKEQIAETKTELEAYSSSTQPNIIDKDGCFTSDMFVLMEKGSKHISDIKVGDRVLTSKQHGKICVKEVLKHYIYDNNHYYFINKKIKVTGLHRFFTQDGWKKVHDLQTGDEIWTSKKYFQ
ncbi:MAG: hypothetical protein KAR45_08670, partial [Desulfobacteraceae bacterium]|nr:hypothetical protein [Desulfobacteraceae bacterium]